jgi:hypothetical protein
LVVQTIAALASRPSPKQGCQVEPTMLKETVFDPGTGRIADAGYHAPAGASDRADHR